MNSPKYHWYPLEDAVKSTPSPTVWRLAPNGWLSMLVNNSESMQIVILFYGSSLYPQRSTHPLSHNTHKHCFWMPFRYNMHRCFESILSLHQVCWIAVPLPPFLLSVPGCLSTCSSSFPPQYSSAEVHAHCPLCHEFYMTMTMHLVPSWMNLPLQMTHTMSLLSPPLRAAN